MLHRAGEEALLVDPALQGALDWREKTRPNAVWARRYHPEFETALSFLDQSVAARDAETQRARAAAEKRSHLQAVEVDPCHSGFSIYSLASLSYLCVLKIEPGESRTVHSRRRTHEARKSID